MPSGPFGGVGIAHSFGDVATQIELRHLLLFQLFFHFEFIELEMFAEVRKVAFVLFNLLLFHYARSRDLGRLDRLRMRVNRRGSLLVSVLGFDSGGLKCACAVQFIMMLLFGWLLKMLFLLCLLFQHMSGAGLRCRFLFGRGRRYYRDWSNV